VVPVESGSLAGGRVATEAATCFVETLPATGFVRFFATGLADGATAGGAAVVSPGFVISQINPYLFLVLLQRSPLFGSRSDIFILASS
jgi:hypothetical protein